MGTSLNAVLLPQITALWQQVLPAGLPEPDTHFFLAGGDSLQLGRLLLRVHEQLGIELRLQDLPHFSTPRKMAQWCGPLVACAGKSQPAVQPILPVKEFAASSTQQGLWWSEQQAGVTGLYNSGVVLELQGALQWQVLAAAIDALLEHFPLLASCLQLDPRQRRLLVRLAASAPRLQPPVTVALQDLPALLARWAAEPFELDRSVFRCQLLRHSDNHHSLLLCGHHCVLDGWSGGVLLRQLATNYRELGRDPHWQSPAADPAFAEHCQRQQQRFSGTEHRQQLDWWRQRMSSCNKPQSSLPWQPQAHHWPYRVQQLCWQLPVALLPRLQALCAAHQCTLFSVLATALAAALRSVGTAAGPVIGFPLAARVTAQEEDSVGCYMQLLPLPLDSDATQPLATQLMAMHDNVQAVLAHAIPLPELVGTLRPQPLADGNAWFNVVLALQNFPLADCDWSPLTASWRPLPTSHGQYLLKLEVTGNTIAVEYAEAVVPLADVQQLLHTMDHVLQQLGD